MADTLWIDKLSTGDYWAVGDASNHVWLGQGGFNPGENVIVAQVVINVRDVGSSGLDWQIEIRTMSGTSLGSIITGGTSSTLVISSTGVKTFTGLNASLSSGTSYAIVLCRADHSYSGSGLNIYGSSSDNSVSGTWRVWGDDQTQSNDYTPEDFGMKVYISSASDLSIHQSECVGNEANFG